MDEGRKKAFAVKILGGISKRQTNGLIQPSSVFDYKPNRGEIP